jgi:hypothetical protein
MLLFQKTNDKLVKTSPRISTKVLTFSVRWFKLVAGPFKEEFGDILYRLERNASVVDATAVACHIARSSRFQTAAMVTITRIDDGEILVPI